MSEAETSKRSAADLAEALRGMGPAGIGAALFILAALALGPPVAAVLVFVWIWASRTPLADIGLKRPKSWIGVLVLGVAGGVVLKLAMKAAVMPAFGAPALAPIYQNLRGDLGAFLIEVPQMIVLAGFAEEIVFRGFFINRLTALMGSSAASSVGIVLLTAAVFGPAHYVTQGFFGMLQGTIIGVLFAAIYLLNGRRLWSLIVAHAAFDVTAIWLIHAGLEERVAHAIFS
jgi:membrane protease YdiL (CAAX protease family)